MRRWVVSSSFHLGWNGSLQRHRTWKKYIPGRSKMASQRLQNHPWRHQDRSKWHQNLKISLQEPYFQPRSAITQCPSPLKSMVGRPRGCKSQWLAGSWNELWVIFEAFWNRKSHWSCSRCDCFEIAKSSKTVVESLRNDVSQVQKFMKIQLER